MPQTSANAYIDLHVYAVSRLVRVALESLEQYSPGKKFPVCVGRRVSQIAAAT